jgi:hypothetical protein
VAATLLATTVDGGPVIDEQVLLLILVTLRVGVEAGRRCAAS